MFGAPDKIYANGISAHGLPLPSGSAGHLLGTDSIGRDMLARLAYGGRTTLEFTFIYNDYFWPLLFIQSGDRLPVTTAINNLQGVFLSNYNLLAAGATITVIPTLIVYLLLQRQFVAGLTLGASKG